MFKTILLGVDGSEHGWHAARVASDLARCHHSEMWLVSAYDPLPAYLGEPAYMDIVGAHIKIAESNIQEALSIVGEIPGEIHTEVLEGGAAEAILTVAQARQVDLIVMGSRGLGRLAGLLLGSQSQKVVQHADCPVLIVR